MRLMDNTYPANSNGHSNHAKGQENVWLEFITDNKDFLVSFRTRVRKISSALYMLGNLWQEDDFGKHLHSVSLTILSASKIPVTDNRQAIMNHFMSVKEAVEYALSLIIFGAEAGLLATSNVTMVTPFCIALLGDLHDLEKALPTLFDTPQVSGKRTRQAPDVSADLSQLLTKDHKEFFNKDVPDSAQTRVQSPTTREYIHISTQNQAVQETPDHSDIHTPMATEVATIAQTTTPQSTPVIKQQAPVQTPTIIRKEPVINEHREAIFNAIKESQQRTPSELQTQFPALNPKRIQRELQQLVQENRILKKGEKRWVSYHLNAS